MNAPAELRDWRSMDKAQRLEVIEAHCTKGESASRACEALAAAGIYPPTRNAILGFYHRHMQEHQFTFQTNTHSKGRGASRPRREAPRFLRFRSAAAAFQPVEPAADESPVLDLLNTATPMLAAKAGQCRFPLWGDEKMGAMLVCGDKAEIDTSYCPHHHDITHDGFGR